MAIVRDGTTLKFFVDGVLEATSSCSGGTFMNSSTIKIGKNDKIVGVITQARNDFEMS